MEPEPRSITPESADDVADNVEADVVDNVDADDDNAADSSGTKHARLHYEQKPDGHWACKICGQLLGGQKRWHNQDAVKHLEGEHELTLELKKPELTKDEKEKLQEVRRLLRENCRLRQEIMFLMDNEHKECWCAGEPMNVLGTFLHTEPADETILKKIMDNGRTAVPAKRLKQPSGGSLSTDTTANQDRGGNTDSQSAGSSNASASQGKEQKTEKDRRRAEQLCQSQKRRREKIKPYSNKVNSLKVEQKKLITTKQEHIVKLQTSGACLEQLLTEVREYHRDFAQHLQRHAEVEEMFWPQSVGPVDALAGDESQLSYEVLGHYLDQHAKMDESRFQIRDVIRKIGSMIESFEVGQSATESAAGTLNDATIYGADEYAVESTTTYEVVRYVHGEPEARHNLMAMGSCQQSGASSLTDLSSGSDASSEMSSSFDSICRWSMADSVQIPCIPAGAPSYVPWFVKLLEVASPAALYDDSWAGYRRLVLRVEDAVDEWHKLKKDILEAHVRNIDASNRTWIPIGSTEAGTCGTLLWGHEEIDLMTEEEDMGGLTHELDSLSFSSETKAQQKPQICPTMDANRVYAKRTSYTTEELCFIEKNLGILWLIALTAFEKQDRECYFAMADYLGSLIDSILLAFDDKAATRIRTLFGIPHTKNGDGPITAGFGLDARDAECPLLFELPDDILIDVFRSVPSLGTHSKYKSVMRAICRSWAEFVEKNKSVLPVPSYPCFVLSPVFRNDDTFRDEDTPLNERREGMWQQNGILVFDDTSFQDVKPEDFKLVSDLSSGDYAEVTMRKLHGRPMAVKKTKRDNIELFHRWLTDLKDHLYICMELKATCLEKLLFKMQSGFPEEVIGKMTLSVVLALDYLDKKHSFEHGNVKPSNILLDRHGNVTLCPFGISGQLSDPCAGSAYWAPEGPYYVSSDVWSLGITMIHLATRKLPYDQSLERFELEEIIRNKEPPRLDEDSGFSPEFRGIVGRCLQKEKQNRPKCKVLLQDQFLRRAREEDVDVGLWFTNPDEYLKRKEA